MNADTHLIKNKKLYQHDAIKILESGLFAAKAENFVTKFIKKDKLSVGTKSYILSKYNKIWIIAAGKAAYQMTRLTDRIIRADGGIVVVPESHGNLHLRKNYQIVYAGHPIPNKKSVFAAKLILTSLQKMGKNDLIVFLISGGTSSLICLPLGVSLTQKQQIIKVLLKSGASIGEINAIRKHLSSVKGGYLVRNMPCDAVSYIMSDVVGNDPSSIASGMTCCDNTTFSDCLDIIKKFDLAQKLPQKVIQRFQSGVKGKIQETPKRAIIPNVIIASNQDCVNSMVRTAKRLGYKTKVLSPISGDVKTVSEKILKEFSFEPKSCLVFGGEPTVIVKGKGKGGRNQELVLQILSNLNENVIVASIGTDGIDGNTKYAGAIFESVAKQDTKNYLMNNNSNLFFQKHGGLILTGPTHTNLLDVGLILRH